MDAWGTGELGALGAWEVGGLECLGGFDGLWDLEVRLWIQYHSSDSSGSVAPAGMLLSYSICTLPYLIYYFTFELSCVLFHTINLYIKLTIV